MQDNPFGRLVGVLLDPSKTFRSIAERPGWVAAFLLLIVLTGVVTSVVSSKIDFVELARQQIEDSGREIPPEQVEQQLEFMARFGPILAFIGVAFVLVGFPLTALLFWLVFKIMSSEMSFKQSFATTLHGTFPSWGLGALLTLPVVLGKAELTSEEVERGSFLLSNAAAFAPEDASPALLAFLQSLDVFSIWSILVLTLGFSIVGRISKAKAAIGVVGLWALYVAGKIGFAVLGQAFGG